MNKEVDRPMVGGEKKNTKQQVYIGFVGIKSCGKPVCIECGGA